MEILSFIIFLITLLLLAFKLLVKDKERPEVDGVQYRIKTVVDNFNFYVPLFSFTLVLVNLLLQKQFASTVVISIVIFLVIYDRTKLPNKINELVINDQTIFLINRNSIYTKLAIGKLKKVIFRKEKIELYSSKFEFEFNINKKIVNLDAFNSYLKTMDIEVFDRSV